MMLFRSVSLVPVLLVLSACGSSTPTGSGGSGGGTSRSAALGAFPAGWGKRGDEWGDLESFGVTDE